jgi:hypothetical protein
MTNGGVSALAMDHPETIEDAFGGDIDYAMLIKLYGAAPEGRGADRRYSPAKVIGTRYERISGAPNAQYTSTSYAVRHNLTMRMQMRRFTRLTNAFSKKIDNHMPALALYFVSYNWIRIHKTALQRRAGFACTRASARATT